MPSANDKTVSTLTTLAGVKRDGTALDGNFYSEALWCRFRNGRPKKMGGYQEMTNGLNGPIRQIFPVGHSPLSIVYALSGWGVQGMTYDASGAGSGGAIADRTPAGFAQGDIYTWQADSIFDVAGGTSSTIVIHAAENLVNINNNVPTPIYYGLDSDMGTPFADTGQTADGGICVLQPFLFAYGSNGLIKNSAANNVLDWAGGSANTANVAGTKVIKGAAIRGGSSSPAGLFWSLDSLIRVTFVGGTVKWRYDTISARTSILSADGVVEYDGQFYWPGVDRFLMYNGVIKEVANPLNQDFFFDNLNWNYRTKVWGTALPRWGEIWWFFPKGDATECNWAVIYNVRESTWYDTPIERSAGYSPRVFTFPVWADAQPNTGVSNAVDATRDSYRTYRHEFGTDAITGDDQFGIQSYFETSNFGFASGMGGQGVENQNVNTRITRIEPDFVMSGSLSVTVRGQPQAQADDVASDPISFDGSTATVDPREQRRLMRLRIESNEAGGNYFAGKLLVHLEPGDERP